MAEGADEALAKSSAASRCGASNTIERAFTDKGYRGHNAPPDYKLKIFTAGQRRRVTPKIKRQMRKRSAIEPVIGHMKAEHRMGRNYLWDPQGDALNALLAAARYNFNLLLKRLSLSLLRILRRSSHAFNPSRPETQIFTDDHRRTSAVLSERLVAAPSAVLCAC